MVLVCNLNCDVIIYWGGCEEKYFYDFFELEVFFVNYLNLCIEFVVEQLEEGWCGCIGMVFMVVLQDYGMLVGYDIYIVGCFEMVKIVCDLFCYECNVWEDCLFGDVFVFI